MTATKGSRPRRWEVTSHTLRQIVLTDDYLAVFTQDEPDGSLSLHAEPVQALAVARAVTTTYEHREGERRPDELWKEHATEVVGLELTKGYWQVVNEMCNFAGLCRKGEDIYRVTGCVRAGDLSRIKRPAARPEGTDGAPEPAGVNS